MTQSFLTFDSMDISVSVRWKAVEQYFTVVLFVFQFYPVCIFFEKCSVLNLALSGVKGLISRRTGSLMKDINTCI